MQGIFKRKKKLAERHGSDWNLEEWLGANVDGVLHEGASGMLSQELLRDVVSYCVAMKMKKMDQFLYILVPPEAADEVEFSCNVIRQLLAVIPVGLRSQFKFAVNAREHENFVFDILFKRDDGEETGRILRLDGSPVPSFMKDTDLSGPLNSLITRCVEDREFLSECNQIAKGRWSGRETRVRDLYEQIFCELKDCGETGDRSADGCGCPEAEMGGLENPMEEAAGCGCPVENPAAPGHRERKKNWDSMRFGEDGKKLGEPGDLTEEDKDSIVEEPEKEYGFACRKEIEDRLGSYCYRPNAGALYEIFHYLEGVSVRERPSAVEKICREVIAPLRKWEERNNSQMRETAASVYGALLDLLTPGEREDFLEEGTSVSRFSDYLQKLYPKQDIRDWGKEAGRFGSFEDYFFCFRKRYRFCKEIQSQKKEVRQAAMEGWPASNMSFSAFIAAMTAVEGRTAEQIREFTPGAFSFYQEECDEFYGGMLPVHIGRECSLAQIYWEVLYYASLFNGKRVCLTREKAGGKGKEFWVSCVLACLEDLLLDRTGPEPDRRRRDQSQPYGAQEELERAQRHSCRDFLLRYGPAAGSGRRGRCRGRRQRGWSLKLAVYRACAAGLLAVIGLSAYAAVQLIKPGIGRWTAVGKAGAGVEHIQERVARIQSGEDISRMAQAMMEKNRKDFYETQKEEGLRLWAESDYRRGYEAFASCPAVDLASDPLVFEREGQAIREYLALISIMELMGADGEIGTGFILENVDFYDIRGLAEGVLNTSRPAMELRYSVEEKQAAGPGAGFWTEAERGNRREWYLFSEEAGKYLNGLQADSSSTPEQQQGAGVPGPAGAGEGTEGMGETAENPWQMALFSGEMAVGKWINTTKTDNIKAALKEISRGEGME